MRKDRLKILLVIFLLMFAFLVGNLLRIQIIHNKYWSNLASQQSIVLKKETGSRGEIVSSDGIVLAQNINSYDLEVDVKNISDKHQFSIFINLLDLDTKDDWEEDLEKRKYFIVAKGLSYRDKLRVEKDPQYSIFKPALFFRESLKRSYRDENINSVIGLVNTDNIGVCGLEKIYEEELKASSRMVKKIFSASRKEEIDGASLHLTIDYHMQSIVEIELTKAMERYQAKSATAIVVKPKDGSIISMVSLPTPKKKFMKHRAVSDLYEPGSVIKPLIVALALDSKSIDEDFTCYTLGSLELYGLKIADEPGCKKGDLTLTEAIGFSTNVGMVQIANEVDDKVFSKYISQFGFGSKTSRDFFGESKGILHPVKTWSKVSKSYMSHGYEIGCTPIQICMAWSAMVSGEYVEPRIVDKVVYKDGTEFKKESTRFRVIAPEVADKMKEILKFTIDQGTGRRKAKVPGYSIGGKTGTTKKVVNGGYEHNKYFIASFLGAYPIEDPEYLFYVQIDEPRKVGIYGSTIAAPVFKQIFKRTIAHDN